MKRLKLIGEVCAVIGLILLFIDNLCSPHSLLLESSPSRPSLLSWTIWFFAATGTIVYIVADRLSSRESRIPKQINHKIESKQKDGETEDNTQTL